MGDSAKKLKQLRLPFQVLTPGAKSTISAVTPPKSEAQVVSRKRRPSNDGDNSKSSKIGKTADSSKENIAAETTPEVIEIDDNSDKDQDSNPVSADEIDESAKATSDSEKTPTSSATVLHIKLPTSCKRKINADSIKPVEEEKSDDSVVYLDKEELRKSSKKSKKGSKKTKKKNESSKASAKVKKVLKMVEAIAEEEIGTKDQTIAITKDEPDEQSIIANTSLPSSTEIKSDPTSPEITLTKSPAEIFNYGNKSGSLSSSKADESINDEIIGMLSGDSDDSKGKGSNAKTPIANLENTKKLTPKQIKWREELEARRAEKEAQRQKEREEKEKQRLKEKEARDDIKRKEKEAKDEVKRKEQEERDAKKLSEKIQKRQKEEEKKRAIELRDEEKRKRDDALKKKDQEKLDEENRKKRAAEAFSKFFVSKKKSELPLPDDEISKDSAESVETLEVVKSNFMPFQIKEKMRIAPCVRTQISKDKLKLLDSGLKCDASISGLYLQQLKGGYHKPLSSGKTWPYEVDDDVIPIDELEDVGENIPCDDATVNIKHRAKFFLFSENKRPAFHGTWRKKSCNISSRKPLAQDNKFFDYEVDSDDEWEEEEPGESLHGSDDEKDKDGEDDDYDIDNEFFVPHGHLSDEEIQQMDDDVLDDNSPETQKAKLKILQQEFAAEMKKKTEKIKPRLIGCIWMNGDEDENGCSNNRDTDKKYHCSDVIWRILKAREMMTNEDEIKLDENLEPAIASNEEKPTNVQKAQASSKSQMRVKIADELSIKELIKLVHGNINNKKFLIREYQAYRLKKYHVEPNFQEFSGKSIEDKIMEISEYRSCPEEGAMFGKKCWLVKANILKDHFEDEKLSLPNQWTYILEKEKKVKPIVRKDDAREKASKEPKSGDSEIAKAENLIEASIEKTKPSTATPQPIAGTSNKKRVQLIMSVPCGQSFPENKKNNLISQYLKANKPETDAEKMDVDDVVVID